MTVILVRHAAAGERSRWSGDDRLRPLDGRGRRQATELADALASRGVERVLTSPYVRCRQTVDPLAEALGLAVEERVELAEGAGAAAIVQLVGRLRGAVAVLCTHGDVIAAVLGEESEKGSAWVLEPDAGGGLSPREYLHPAV
ncbi:MAG: SixA phosphatase family protein [Gaiellaceae bacterium]